MLVTEDEARTKWCPFKKGAMFGASLQIKAAASSGATTENILRVSFCDGGMCMAWRWDEDVKRDDKFIAAGYCGLAGKPWPRA